MALVLEGFFAPLVHWHLYWMPPSMYSLDALVHLLPSKWEIKMTVRDDIYMQYIQTTWIPYLILLTPRWPSMTRIFYNCRVISLLASITFNSIGHMVLGFFLTRGFVFTLCRLSQSIMSCGRLRYISGATFRRLKLGNTWSSKVICLILGGDITTCFEILEDILPLHFYISIRDV